MASTELAENPKTRVIQGFLQKRIGDLSKACPKHLTPERLIQVAVVCAYRNPAIQECDPASLLAAVVQASSLGLDISPSMGEAYLIPRWNSKARCQEVQFQPGYRGLVKLARQAGGISYIQAEIVREKDKFTAYRDPDWNIRHEPHFGKSGGEVTAVYAVAKFASGEYQLSVMGRDEVEDIRRRSQSGGSGPWVTDWNEMAKKTVLKRLCKGLPNNADPVVGRALAEAIEIDNQDYEDARDGHHAKNFNNHSGHGSGAYAKPEDVKAYERWTKEKVDYINQMWLDKNTGEDGEIRVPVKEVLTHFQLRGHLYKWATNVGLIVAPEEARSSKDKYTAVAWVNDQDQVEEEVTRYGREKWAEVKAKCMALNKPEVEPDDEGDADEGAEAFDPLDGLTEDNYVAEEEEPGSDG